MFVTKKHYKHDIDELWERISELHDVDRSWYTWAWRLHKTGKADVPKPESKEFIVTILNGTEKLKFRATNYYSHDGVTYIINGKTLVGQFPVSAPLVAGDYLVK